VGILLRQSDAVHKDVVAARRVRGFVDGSHLVSSFVEMKFALSKEEDSQAQFMEETREEADAGVPERTTRR